VASHDLVENKWPMLRPHHINLHIIITMCLKKGKKKKREIVVFKGLECLTKKKRAKTIRPKPVESNFE
jgi:hypothetical protein